MKCYLMRAERGKRGLEIDVPTKGGELPAVMTWAELAFILTGVTVEGAVYRECTVGSVEAHMPGGGLSEQPERSVAA